MVSNKAGNGLYLKSRCRTVTIKDVTSRATGYSRAANSRAEVIAHSASIQGPIERPSSSDPQRGTSFPPNARYDFRDSLAYWQVYRYLPPNKHVSPYEDVRWKSVPRVTTRSFTGAEGFVPGRCCSQGLLTPPLHAELRRAECLHSRSR